ncbi:Double zinc ribbon [Phycisphaerae bacterium RAS1]|nr:Double zinc ribbon [Phycisphaerae bacterium RAS1]
MDIDLNELPIPDWNLVCPTCGYPLRGLPEHRCPECGTRFSVPELLRSWTCVRPPRYTGGELPVPNFGLCCASCCGALAGATAPLCPQCQAPFDLRAGRPRAEWFAVEPWMCFGLALPMVEALLDREYIPCVVRENRSFADIYIGSPTLSVQVFVHRDFYFDVLWLNRHESDEIARRRAESDRPWKCPACGEICPRHFDICWSCQSARVENADEADTEPRP